MDVVPVVGAGVVPLVGAGTVELSEKPAIHAEQSRVLVQVEQPVEQAAHCFMSVM